MRFAFLMALALASAPLGAQTASPPVVPAPAAPAPPDTSTARRIAAFLAPGVGIALGERIDGQTGAIVGGLIGTAAGVALAIVEERHEQVRGRDRQLCFVPGDPGTPTQTIPSAPGMPDIIIPGTPPTAGRWEPCR